MAEIASLVPVMVINVVAQKRFTTPTKASSTWPAIPLWTTSIGPAAAIVYSDRGLLFRDVKALTLNP